MRPLGCTAKGRQFFDDRFLDSSIFILGQNLAERMLSQRKLMKGLVGMRTIRVTGKGMIKVKPDMMRITITLRGTYPEYRQALYESSEMTENLKRRLSAFHFGPSDLKTVSFDINTQYQNYKKGDEYLQRFIGYRFEHVLKVEFDADNARLGRVLYALARDDEKPEIKISYTVKDREAAKDVLLGKAVQDAQAKAAILTQAAGVALRDIQSIDYSWGEINFDCSPMHGTFALEDKLMPKAELSSYDLDLEPDDIEVADTVTVIWEIL